MGVRLKMIKIIIYYTKVVTKLRKISTYNKGSNYYRHLGL